MLYGLAMETPLTLSLIMQHAKKLYARREIVSYSKDRGLFQYTYGDAFSRVAQLAHALQGLGVATSERIATLAHNDFRHFELYFATACSGAVCHTINPRLFDQQIEYIINHAENRWVFVDPDFVPLLEKLQHQLPNILGYIVLCDPDHMPQTDLKNTHCYETLIQHQPKQYDWPELDERLACGICYTSGTTGNPKGVLYSHRSTTLATLSCLPASSWHIQESDVVLASVPMYHANAWNLPYAGALTGAKLVLPGPRLGNGEYDQQLIQRYGVTVTAGVPTVALSLLTYLRKSGKSVDSLTRMVVGGSACPQTMMEEFESDYGVFIHHAWGMTELNPLGSMNHLLPSQDPNNSWRQRRSVGRPVFGVDIKIVDASDNELPWDDTVSGLLKVRGPWVCNEYYKLGKTDANGDDG